MHNKLNLFVIMLALSISRVKSACLNSTTLNSLGFTKILDTPETNSDVCKGLYDKGGSCVDVDDLKIRVEEDNAALKAAYGSIDEMPEYFDILMKVIDDHLSTLLSADSITSLKTLFQKFKDEIKENSTPCLEAMAELQQGFLCYTTSSQASENSIDVDTSLGVNTNKASLAKLDSCFYIFASFCMISTKLNPLTSADPDIIPVNYELDDRCDAWHLDPDCNIDKAETCKEPGAAIGKYFFEVNDILLYPTESQIKTATDNLELAAEFLEKGNKSRFDSLSGLLAKGSVYLNKSDTGEDLATYGENSGIDFKYSTIIKTYFVVVALLAWG